MCKLYNRFVIIIPVCNAEELIGEAILSVINQNFPDCGVIIRDDLSTDNTPQIIEKLTAIDGRKRIQTRINGKDILYIRNTKKLYGPGNTYDSVVNFVGNPEAIVGVVDGDDKLLNDFALAKIYDVYLTRKVFLVWSRHQAKSLLGKKPAGFSRPLPPDSTIYATRDYWAVSHFRTCKAWLFNKIDPNDLLDPFSKSSYFIFAADGTVIYPITEMCGNRHAYFLDEVLYQYNDQLPSNEHNKSLNEVKRYTEVVRSKKRYAPLPFR